MQATQDGVAQWTVVDVPPAWMPLLLEVLAVPVPPSLWQEAPFLPRDLGCVPLKNSRTLGV